MNTIPQRTAQQIVEAVKDVCRHDINFIDETGHILASTIPSRIGNYHEAAVEVLHTQAPVEVFNPDSFHGARPGVNVPVFYSERIVAVIGITGIPDSVRIYAQLAEKITKLILRERDLNSISRSRSEKKHYLLTSLSTDLPKNPKVLDTLVEELGLDKRSPKRSIILKFMPHSSHDTLAEAEFKLQRFFEDMRGAVFCYQYPNEFFALLDEPTYQGISNKFATYLNKHCPFLYAGSGSRGSLFQTISLFRTARIALNHSISKGLAFCCFDELTLEILLASIGSEGRDEYLLKTISALSPEDIHLLMTYFESDCSLTKTSQVLFIHKNTLQYKLDRIHKLCGLNPRCFRDGAELYFAVRLLDLPSESTH